jgi:hypothetical protein
VGVPAAVQDNNHRPSFDPVRIARLETTAWLAYYRHEWLKVLSASYGLVRDGFDLPYPQTLRGAWLVLRANQVWAPYPDNDPDRARAYMTTFYTMVNERASRHFDPVEAARLEVEWWRVHRVRQHGVEHSLDELGDAVAALYAYVYGIEVASVVDSGRRRALAMDACDRWVADGCDPASPLVNEVGGQLLRSYRSLRTAIDALPEPSQ